MTDKQTAPTLELAHTLMSEEDALAFLHGHRISLGARTMDPKAQIVGEFVKSIRVPGYYPPLPELRQQLRTMVGLMDEPAPALPRIEDIRIPGPAGSIGARIYSSAAKTASVRPVVAYFHGGGWVQGDLETHHGLCARLAERAGAIVVAVDYRLAPEHKFPAAVEDCLAAYRWLRSRATELGGNAGRVGLAGDSAGGNLSAVVSQLSAAAGDPEKYHHTMTLFWMRRLAVEQAIRPDASLDDILTHTPALLDKNLPLAYYSPGRLFSEEARAYDRAFDDARDVDRSHQSVSLLST